MSQQVTTEKKERKRIARLVKQDQHDSDHLASFYRNAMVMISAHLNTFYQEYADENGLTLTEVDQQVNAWDMEHFKLAIDSMVQTGTPSDSLATRLQLAYAQATVSRRNLLAALIGAGIAVASDLAEEYGRKSIDESYQNGYHDRSGNSAPSTPNKVKTPAKDYSSRVWVHNDQMTIKMQQTMNRALQRGADKAAWQQLIKFKTVSSSRESGNLASDMNTEVTQDQAALRSQNSSADSEASKDAYKDMGIFYVTMITQPGVCDTCEQLASEGPWLIDDAPHITEDTHPNCRCSLVGSDQDGNIIAPLIED